MPKTRWVVAIALLLLGGALRGLADSGTRYSTRSWIPEEPGGLPQSSITSITQGTDGYLWLGTLNGLVRFDGNHFTTFDENNTPALGSSRIFFVFAGSHGDLWIGTEAGTRLVKDGQVKPVEAAKDFRKGVVRSACEDHTGAVWLYADNGTLLHYHNGHVDAVQFPTNRSSCHVVIAEKSGPVWLGNNQALYTTGTNGLSTPSPPYPFALANVDYLVASAGGGFWCLANGHIQRWRNSRMEDLGPYAWNNLETPVICACEDRDGNLVVGTHGAGVYWRDPDGTFHQLSRAQGLLTADVILSLAVDRDDTLWVGTDGFGLNRVKRSPFVVDDEGRTVQSVCEDGVEGMWIGFNGGGTNSNLGYGRGMINREVDGALQAKSVLVDRAQRVWAGITMVKNQQLIQSGLFEVLTNGLEQQYHIGLLDPVTTEVRPIQNVSAIFQDTEGVLWVGTAEGLWSHNRTNWNLLTARDGLSSDDIRAIAGDASGNLWIGTANAGLNRLHDGKMVSFHKKDGLPNDHISSLYSDNQGVLWVGTSGGLGRLQDGHWTTYTVSNGLASDTVGYMIEDGQSNLWLGSFLGLMRVSKKSLNDVALGLTNFVSCRAFGKSDGLLASECTFGSQPAACRTRDGRLWFPTINGLVSVDSAALKPDTNAPPVVIESVTVEGIPQGAQTLGTSPPAGITVPAGREQLDIHYTSLNLAAADKARFRYRMDPYETHWVEAGDRRIAPYPKLPLGNYHFLVTACNEDGLWNDSPATLEIAVLPPFWRKWWFLFGCALCLLAMIVGIVHYVSTQKLQRQLVTLRQQQALEKERARIARDIHDQLGASLTQVSLLGEMVESDKDSPAEVEAHARQISQTARDTTRALDEIVWTVNPSNDTLEGIANYLCKYAQEYLTVAGFRYRQDVPAQLPAVVISPEVRHNVFLAAREAITNIVRHARAASVSLRLRVEADSFVLEIQDDGLGIPNLEEKLAGPRNGLRNMARRMEDIGGSFAARPASGGGTLICLTVPIPKH